MRKAIIGASAAAVALGGAAVAWGDDPSADRGDVEAAVAALPAPHAAFGPGPQGTFAEDLAAELDLPVDEVERALDAVADDQMAEHRRALAEAIAEELDGVSVEQIESALESADERMREALESGEPPPPDVFTETLADELGLSEDEVADALAAARGQAFEGRGDLPMLEFEREPGDLERRLPPPPPGFGHFAVPAG